jgi:hypothetical protein
MLGVRRLAQLSVRKRDDCRYWSYGSADLAAVTPDKPEMRITPFAYRYEINCI